jgi:hypothetical protein
MTLPESEFTAKYPGAEYTDYSAAKRRMSYMVVEFEQQ